MSHDHGHSHGTKQVSDKVLLWTIVFNLGLSVFEFIAGLIAGSVALMADALHNTNDAGALVVAYVARKVSRRGSVQNLSHFRWGGAQEGEVLVVGEGSYSGDLENRS